MQDAKDGTDRWRSLAELAGHVDPDAAREFPEGVDVAPSGVARRDLLRLFGASLMLAGVGACTRAPRERIVPYGSNPPELTPGVGQTYATSMTLDGYATGLLVQSHEGRPTKVEGNPDHPASLGASGVLEQAAILSLYDPARARGLLHRGSLATYRAFAEAMSGSRRSGDLSGVHVLLEPTSSPTTAALAERAAGRGAEIHTHGAVDRRAAWEGAKIAFGRTVDVVLEPGKADVVLTLDADWLASGPFHLRYARRHADRRRVRSRGDTMSRLYVAEPALTVTGAAADHRLRIRRVDVVTLAAAILREVLAGAPQPAWPRPFDGPWTRQALPDADARWARAAARDLLAHRGAGLVVAGDAQPPLVHACAHAINAVLGNVGQTVSYVEPAIVGAGTDSHGLVPLAAALEAGRVDTILILGGNPVYTAPVDVGLSALLERARVRACMTAYENETAGRCEWTLPAAHFLEAWGDARALDGTVSFVQPLISPLYDGLVVNQVLATLLGQEQASAHDLLSDHWRARAGGFEERWPAWLQLGKVDVDAGRPLAVQVSPDEVARQLARMLPPPQGLEITFDPDPRVHDGAFANNAWLQELPHPITKLTWTNAAVMSPGTAARLGVRTGDLCDLALHGRSVRAPAIVAPGAAEDSVALSLGYGREGSEENARGLGANANRLRRSTALGGEVALSVTRTGRSEALAVTQEHWSMEGRPIARTGTLLDYLAGRIELRDANKRQPTLYQLRPGGAQQWAMSIDLNACTGCGACTIACQAENNIPVVGKAGVQMSREMHWIRVDRYFTGDENDPEVAMQPMACQHCEKAPCEYVCPVGATVHSSDGLNEMVYNRCVGTRFCQNNCPYKVRRFNWLDYNRDKPETHQMAMNPDVTVRARGVMEKCTYCVQRIREVEIHARIQGRPIAAREVVTACQQACSSQAIEFGSLTDPSSEVARLRSNDRTYAVLGELGVEPRTRYMVRLHNKNPELAGS